MVKGEVGLGSKIGDRVGTNLGFARYWLEMGLDGVDGRT